MMRYSTVNCVLVDVFNKFLLDNLGFKQSIESLKGKEFAKYKNTKGYYLH